MDKITYYFPLLTQVFKTNSHKYYPEEGINFSCCFCNKKSPEVSFNSISHIIPESLGNKELISREECDECNGKYASSDGGLAEYLAPIRGYFGVFGKQGLVTFSNKSKTFESLPDGFLKVTTKDSKTALYSEEDEWADIYLNKNQLSISLNLENGTTPLAEIQTALLRSLWMFLGRTPELRSKNAEILRCISEKSFYKPLKVFSLINKENYERTPSFSICVTEERITGFQFHYLDLIFYCSDTPPEAMENCFIKNEINIGNFSTSVSNSFNQTLTYKSESPKAHENFTIKDNKILTMIKRPPSVEGKLLFYQDGSLYNTIEKSFLYCLQLHGKKESWRIQSSSFNMDLVKDGIKKTHYGYRNKQFETFASLDHEIELNRHLMNRKRVSIEFLPLDLNRFQKSSVDLSNFSLENDIMNLFERKGIEIKVTPKLWEDLVSYEEDRFNKAKKALYWVFHFLKPEKRVYNKKTNDYNLPKEGDYRITLFEEEALVSVNIDTFIFMIRNVMIDNNSSGGVKIILPYNIKCELM